MRGKWDIGQLRMNKPILVTGGTGTLGKQLIPLLLKNRSKLGISRIRVLSRGEHRQLECAKLLGTDYVDFLIGDVRDAERVEYACRDVKGVFHLAAFKSVDKAEYDPEECVKTNVNGTINVIKACIQNGVKKAMFTSSDKAVAPVNIYGASKLCAEKLWMQGNVGKHKTRFSACRYGNVLGSAGSVIEKWREGPPYCLTVPNMTRFWITQAKAARFVLECYQDMIGGEIFIPKMKAARIIEVLSAVLNKGDSAPIDDVEQIGIRPGEKLHEVLFTADEYINVTECAEYFIRWPSHKLYPFKVRGNKPEMNVLSSESCGKYTYGELREMING